jgi:hypothetical protein
MRGETFEAPDCPPTRPELARPSLLGLCRRFYPNNVPSCGLLCTHSVTGATSSRCRVQRDEHGLCRNGRRALSCILCSMVFPSFGISDRSHYRSSAARNAHSYRLLSTVSGRFWKVRSTAILKVSIARACCALRCVWLCVRVIVKRLDTG